MSSIIWTIDLDNFSQYLTILGINYQVSKEIIRINCLNHIFYQEISKAQITTAFFPLSSSTAKLVDLLHSLSQSLGTRLLGA